jgi:hypothetical protein
LHPKESFPEASGEIELNGVVAGCDGLDVPLDSVVLRDLLDVVEVDCGEQSYGDVDAT